MRPCDCKTYGDCQKLNERGLKFNDQSILIVSPSTIDRKMEIDPYVKVNKTKVTIANFKRFAKWYLKDQKKDTCTCEMHDRVYYGCRCKETA